MLPVLSQMTDVGWCPLHIQAPAPGTMEWVVSAHHTTDLQPVVSFSSYSVMKVTCSNTAIWFAANGLFLSTHSVSLSGLDR